MKIRRGTYHEYLGMDLDYSEPGVFKVSMIPYIDKIFKDFPEEVKSVRRRHTLTICSRSETRMTQNTGLCLRSKLWRSITRWRNCCT